MSCRRLGQRSWFSPFTMRILGNLSQVGRHGGTYLYLLNHFAGPRPYLLTILKAYRKTCQVYLDPARPRALIISLHSFTHLGLPCKTFASVTSWSSSRSPRVSLSKTETITHLILTKKAIKSVVELKLIKCLRISRRKSKHTKSWTNSGTNRDYIITYSALETAQKSGCIHLESQTQPHRVRDHSLLF